MNNHTVRVYLVGYIFCIIGYHICQDIFGKIDIMYCRLSYVSGGALPLKTLVLYIPAERHNAIQITIISNLFFLHGNQSLGFFRFRLGSDPRSLLLSSTAPPPGRSISTLPGAAPLFAADPIDSTAFIALTSSCSSRLEVPACRW
jgi:hypothetical protein